MRQSTKYQIGFYLLSMAAFFVVIAILGTNIPICFEKGSKFIGIRECLSTPGIIVPIICLLALIYIVWFVFYLKRRIQGTQLGPISIDSVENINNDIMTFVGSYFLPLVSFSIAEKWQHFVVLIILFIIIGVIYIKSDIYFTNPTLSMLGYRVYRVKGQYLGEDVEKIIIIQSKLKKNDKISYIPIDDNTYYAEIDNHD